MRIGILSDTHGVLRDTVLERLTDCDRLLHAGDVGGRPLLERLVCLAPVDAVRGNVDHGDCADLPMTLERTLGGIDIRMVHRREDIPREWLRAPPEAPPRLVVHGHSHRPELSWHGGVLLLNPGAAGQRRFRLPLTVATVTVRDGRMIPELLSIEGPS